MQFYLIVRYFESLYPLHILHSVNSLHPQSIYSDVQNLCKNVQRAYMDK